MVGIEVVYHCPECNCDRETDLGCTPYIRYRGMKLAVLYCHYCGKKLACSTVDVDSELGFYEYKDDTGLHVLAKLEKHFISRGYTEETPEDQIESEMWHYAVDTFDRVALVNEYEIKSYIQKLLSKMNRGSLFSITFDDLKAESEKAGVCVYQSAGAICW